MSHVVDNYQTSSLRFFPKTALKVVLVDISPDQRYLGQSLGLRTLSSYAAQNKLPAATSIETRAFHAGQKPYEIVRLISECRADIIGFSCYMWNISHVLTACIILKEIDREILIVLGGPEVSYRAGSLLKSNPAVDIIAVGEGERSFVGLLAALQSNPESIRDIKGLTFRCGDKIIDTGLPELLENLDTIPVMFTLEKTQKNSRDTVYLSTTRGCPFHCGFCLGGQDGPVRSLSPDRVKHDLIHLIKAQCNRVHIIDWTFNYDNERAKEIFRFILDHNIDTTFLFEIRPELLERDTLQLLTRLENKPFIFIFEIGIQSVHSQTLRNISRPWNKKQTTAVLRRLSRIRNLGINFNLLRGLPGDNYETFKQGIDYLFRFPHINIDSGLLCLIPGSALRRNSRSLGLKFNQYPPYQVLCTKDFPFSELCRAQDIIETEQFLRPFEHQSAPIRKLLKLAPSKFFELFRIWVEKQGNIDIITSEKLTANEAATTLTDFFSDYISAAGISAEDEPEIHEYIRKLLCKPADRDTMKAGQHPVCGSIP